MNSDAAQEKLNSPEQRPEPWSLLSVAFAAVVGTIISILSHPLVDLLPARLFEEFLSRLVEEVLFFGLPILLGFFAARIRRLDHFLRRYLRVAALCASLLLALSLWSYAGRPFGRWPIISIILTGIEAWLFLLFCGGALQRGLLRIVGKQETAYKDAREAEARQIAAEATAAGDPALAASIFSIDAAGALSKAIMSGCLQIVLLVFHVAAIWTVSSFNAHKLFNLSLAWSSFAGAIIGVSIIPVVIFSEEFGEQHSEKIPLGEKTP